MKHIALAAFGAALLLGSSAVSAQELVECKTPNENANSKAFFSANTNSGKGNGTESATIWFGGLFTTCFVNGPGDDGELQLGNAADPFTVSAFGFPILETASDPGNSPN